MWRRGELPRDAERTEPGGTAAPPLRTETIRVLHNAHTPLRSTFVPKHLKTHDTCTRAHARTHTPHAATRAAVNLPRRATEAQTSLRTRNCAQRAIACVSFALRESLEVQVCRSACVPACLRACVAVFAVCVRARARLNNLL